MKKIVAALIISLVGFSLSYAAVSGFSDLPASHSNYGAITALQESGIVGGYSDGTFRPENKINRAELLKVLVEGRGITPAVSDYHDCFNDVSAEWFAPYICYGKTVGWIDGYSDGSYKPDQTVNKVESIKMVLNSQNVKDIADAVTVAPYSDVPVDTWFAPYVSKAKEMGILPETGSTLNPSQEMTRAAVCEVLYRIINVLSGEIPAVTTPSVLPGQTSAKVTRIVDGDTVELENGDKVRLLGIDTPELSSSDCYATEATSYIGSLILNKTVGLTGDSLNDDKDRYGRLLRYIFLDGVNINKKMVEDGYAHYYRTYPITYAADFAAAENNAKAAQLGLWSACVEGVQEVVQEATGVIISTVFYDGVVPQVESDEYVEVKNNSSSTVNLKGYKIIGSKGDDYYIFPSLSLSPGETVKVYTNQGDYSFGATHAIWNNSGETTYLYDANGALLSEWSW